MNVVHPVLENEVMFHRKLYSEKGLITGRTWVLSENYYLPNVAFVARSNEQRPG